MLFPGGHAASICDNTPEAICRVLEEEGPYESGILIVSIALYRLKKDI
jgi:hypothetical protein